MRGWRRVRRGGRLPIWKWPPTTATHAADLTYTILLQKDAGEVDIGGKKVTGTAVLVSEQGGKRTVTDLAK